MKFLGHLLRGVLLMAILVVVAVLAVLSILLGALLPSNRTKRFGSVSERWMRARREDEPFDEDSWKKRHDIQD